MHHSLRGYRRSVWVPNRLFVDRCPRGRSGEIWDHVVWAAQYDRRRPGAGGAATICDNEPPRKTRPGAFPTGMHPLLF